MKYGYLLLIIALFSGCSQLVYDPDTKSTVNNSIVKQKPKPGFKEDATVYEAPFQVVGAQLVVKNGSGVDLDSLDKLYINEEIKVYPNGHLIVAHYSGMFLEFENDTTFLVRDLARYLEEKMLVDSAVSHYRLDINELFSSTPKKLKPTGARLRSSYSNIYFTLPHGYVAYISPANSKVCLMWETERGLKKPSQYSIRMGNINDETIDKFTTQDNYLTIDLSEYQTDSNVFLFQVYGDNSQTSDMLAIKYDNELFYTPRYCEINSAVKALELAYYFERSGSYLIEDGARKYYELANSLSDHNIYTSLLNYHIKRSKLDN